MKKREIGFKYEEKTKLFLISEGLIYLESNFYTKFGEIDLIFLEEDKETIIFVEVKYRKNSNYGESLEMINWKKQEKIKAASQIFIAKVNWKGNIRYDAVGITKDRYGKENINWIKNAF